MLAQELIEGSGEDLKVYVVGESVFAVRKPFSPTRFTVSGRPMPAAPQVQDIARRCGAALGLYGVDMVERDGLPRTARSLGAPRAGLTDRAP